MSEPENSESPTDAGTRASRIGLLAGPILAAVILALPESADLSLSGHRLAAVTVLMATWWMTEALPVAATALLPLALFPLFEITGAKEVAPAYGADLIWLFFGGFQLAFAIERCGLHRRMALFLVRLVGTRADRLILGFMLASGLLSMWLLNTSTTLMLLPVAMAVAAALEPDGKGPFGIALMLGLAYAASVGGMGTYLGTAPNGVFRAVGESHGVDIGFGEWMLFAAPLSIILMFAIWVYLTRFAFDVPRTELPADHPAQRSLKESAGPWTSAQFRVAVIFLLAVVGWITRKYLFDALGYAPKYITDSTIAIVVAVMLYLIPDGTPTRRPLLEWVDTSRTPWHILLLFGGGFALAAGFAQTGLSNWLGSQLAAIVVGMPLPLVILSVVLLMTFLTEVTSNTATATVLLPVIAGLAVSMELPAEILMLPATLAASCAFMLPVATPPNAIVYGSGLLSLPQMARAGLWINFGTAVIITVWMLTWGRLTVWG